MEYTTMLQEFTVTWQKVQINSLPLPNRNFPNPVKHTGIPVFSKPVCNF